MKMFCFLFALTGCFCCTAQVSKQRIDSVVHKYDSLGGFNGIIIVGYDPEHIATYKYGYEDVARQRGRLKNKDLFDLASLTKQFTGVAILKLAEEQRIGIADTIGKYLPELKPALRQITIAQLANHRSGVHDYHVLIKDHKLLNNDTVMAALSLLDTSSYPPGTKWGYTNSGYVLLSQIIERVTKMPFETYCTKYVLQPMGLNDARFAPGKHTVTGYTADKKPVLPYPFSSGAAGLYASANDMIRYYRTVCGHDTLQRYFTLACELADESNEPGWEYGYGWFFSKDSLGKFRAHSGRDEGAYTYIRWYYDTNVFLCLLSNKNDDFVKPLREEIARLVVSEYSSGMKYKLRASKR